MGGGAALKRAKTSLLVYPVLISSVHLAVNIGTSSWSTVADGYLLVIGSTILQQMALIKSIVVPTGVKD